MKTLAHDCQKLSLYNTGTSSFLSIALKSTKRWSNIETDVETIHSETSSEILAPSATYELYSSQKGSPRAVLNPGTCPVFRARYFIFLIKASLQLVFSGHVLTQYRFWKRSHCFTYIFQKTVCISFLCFSQRYWSSKPFWESFLKFLFEII